MDLLEALVSPNATLDEVAHLIQYEAGHEWKQFHGSPFMRICTFHAFSRLQETLATMLSVMDSNAMNRGITTPEKGLRIIDIRLRDLQLTDWNLNMCLAKFISEGFLHLLHMTNHYKQINIHV
jgi:hypothetical protein